LLLTPVNGSRVRDTPTFSWTTGFGGLSNFYLYETVNVHGRTEFRALIYSCEGLKSSRVELPASVELTPGGIYFWGVSEPIVNGFQISAIHTFALKSLCLADVASVTAPTDQRMAR
jgi:hypothetical protein